MDIHPPMGQTHSFKDFAIHILVVTIGILIALGLEGIRETAHEHSLLAETRQTLRRELEVDRQHLVNETANIQEKSGQLDLVLRDYPELVKTPDELEKRINDLQPGFWYFSGTAWGAVSSSGILAYMKPDEASKYADVYFSIQSYQTLSRQSVLDWTAIKSFFDSRRSFAVQDAVEGEQKLRTFQFDLQAMQHADQEFMPDLKAALAYE